MVRVWAQWPAELTPKVANIIPGSPVAFEGRPTDGLVAGNVCLLTALAGSLRDADVARVVGNMEDEGLNRYRDEILHSISFPRASLIAQLVKNPPAKQKTLVRFLGQEDLLQKG